jgi:hypothetical protein
MIPVGKRQDPPDLTHASGDHYVPVRIKEVPRAGERARKLGRIYVVNNPINCGHVHSMCVACAKSWEIDYEVGYQRTGGGRRLWSMMGNTIPMI